MSDTPKREMPWLAPYQFKKGEPKKVGQTKRKNHLGLAAKIRSATKDGNELLELLLAVARGEIPGGASTSERLKATAMLLDRGFGKEVANIQLAVSTEAKVLDVTALTDDQLRKARDLARLLKANAPAQELDDD